MNLLKRLIASLGRTLRLLIGLVLIAAGASLVVLFGWCRAYVGPDECVVWIRKSGAPLGPNQTVADPGQKGIQRSTSGPGRYFFNPLNWEFKHVPLVTLKSGDPKTWTWIHTASRLPPGPTVGGNVMQGDFPEVGILTRKSGMPHPSGDAVVPLDSDYQGIIREVLTPGTYRINPYEFEVKRIPALVIPAGFVGVVTNQTGAQPPMVEVDDIPQYATGPDTQPAAAPKKLIRPLAAEGQRGTLRKVFTPGVYYVNPYVQRVKVIEVGFNEFSQTPNHADEDSIRFPSTSGFDIELGVVVVWGLHPRHAADVINEFGSTHEVLEKVIKPQLRSICRNQGSLYEARDFIQGDKREEFQQVLTQSLRSICQRKNIELLLALITTVDVYAKEGGAAADEIDLKKEIQDSFIALERQLTNEKLQITATKKALLEEARKKVDVRRETIQAETRKKVAELRADGERTAASIEAEARLQVASIEQQIATLEAEKTELMGRAESEVARLKAQAEADGKRLFVEAFGSGEAYNLYTFARNFDPDSIRLFYSGPGTFWTDLTRFEELGAAEILRQTVRPTEGKKP